MSTKIESEMITVNKGYQAALQGFDEKLPAELKAATLAALIQLCEEAIAATKEAKDRLAAARDAKRKAFKAMNQCVIRTRSSVKGVFGDDSLEFERLGGKRASERKKPVKKAKPATA